MNITALVSLTVLHVSTWACVGMGVCTGPEGTGGLGPASQPQVGEAGGRPPTLGS